MKFHYYPETDSLYIDLVDRASVDSQEVAPGVVLDFDDEGRIVGIDIDHASKVVDLSRVEAESLPFAAIVSRWRWRVLLSAGPDATYILTCANLR